MRGLRLRVAQLAVFVTLLLFWFLMTEPGLIPNFYFSNPDKAAFFFASL